MKEYNYKNLRNVGLIGHGATGKTSLAESLLFYTNNIDRLGKVEDGTTVMDYEQEEKKEKYHYLHQWLHLKTVTLRLI